MGTGGGPGGKCLKLSDFHFRQTCSLNNHLYGYSRTLQAQGNSILLLLTAFCQSFLVPFLKALFLGSVQGIEDIALGIDAVLVLLQLEGRELGYLCLLEYAGEDAFLQGGRT